MFVDALSVSEKTAIINSVLIRNPECTLCIDITALVTVYGRLALDRRFLPPSAKRVCFTMTKANPMAPGVRIASDFLAYCTTIEHIEFLFTASMIGGYFLFNCASLRSVVPPRLQPSTGYGYIAVPPSFLQGCESLQRVDLLPFEGAEEIGDAFLLGCAHLEELDLSPLRNTKTIRSGFLTECTSLQTIDFTPFANVTMIENGFLFRCMSLTSLDLRPLTKLDSIGPQFASSCHRLTSIKANAFGPVISSSGYTGNATIEYFPVAENAKAEQPEKRRVCSTS
eukprot:TRINITY_DN5790_c0_g1_i1.p1 TRINITY_DN5790_c0_g1~~TRINITY_DN5790_c0_g1_i1.p1  ORF type:complete len:317 (+),score=26.24 TRINITY_DN5790_c0_g1_i1:108-953(+)